MDAFRKIQKKQCNDSSTNKPHKFGCQCCRPRWASNTNVFKKVARRLARARLKRIDD